MVVAENYRAGTKEITSVQVLIYPLGSTTVDNGY